MSQSTDSLPIKVAAYLIRGRSGSEDPNARAAFANMDRAEQYARMLADSGTYAEVFMWDPDETCYQVFGEVLVNSNGEVVD